MRSRPSPRSRLAVERLEDRVNPVSFEYGDSGSTWAHGWTIAFGEINGDNHVDMALGTGNGIELFTNDGSGDFSKLVTISAGTGIAGQLELADLTGDGLAEIVSAQAFGNYVTVVPNNGDGTFGTPAAKLLNMYAQDVSTGDFNGDGKLDVVVAIPGGAAVLLNTGTSSLIGNPTYYNYSSSGGAAWVAVGDFNGDAKTDFAVSVHLLRRVDVYLNNGVGGFTRTQYANPVINDTADILTGDFTNDGHLDILVGYYGTGMIGIMRGNGDGTFQTAIITHTGNSGSGPLTIGDFDNDGKLDVVATEYETMRVLPGKGDGTFASAAVVMGSYNADFAAADVNADGRLDLGAISSHSGGDFNILLNTTDAEVIAGFEVLAPPVAAPGVPFTVTVTALDSSGDTMTGYTGTVHFTSTDPHASLPDDTTLTNGVGTFTVILNSEGDWTITVADRTVAAATGTAAVTVVSAGSPVVVADFGEHGLRLWTGGQWVELSSDDPEKFQVSADGKTVVADFGEDGLARWRADTGWFGLSPTDVECFAVSADGATIAADFGRSGLWYWTDAGGWKRIARANVESVAIAADGQTVVADFGVGGIRGWRSDTLWTRITFLNPRSMAVSADARTVVADFGLIGLWRWTASTGQWKWLTPARIGRFAVSADGNTVVASLVGRGLSRWELGVGWTRLSTRIPEQFVLANDGSSVVADFGDDGLRRWTAALGWVELSDRNARKLAVSSTGNLVAASFESGLSLYETTWLPLSPLEAEHVCVI